MSEESEIKKEISEMFKSIQMENLYHHHTSRLKQLYLGDPVLVEELLRIIALKIYESKRHARAVAPPLKLLILTYQELGRMILAGNRYMSIKKTAMERLMKEENEMKSKTQFDIKKLLARAWILHSRASFNKKKVVQEKAAHFISKGRGCGSLVYIYIYIYI